METITFETFPKAFTQLSQEISEIKKLLMEQNTENQSDSDAWFNLNEFCNYHPDKPTKQTVYGWVNAGLLPVHKGGKRLRFLKSEIDEWLKQGKKKTLKELSTEAENYLSNKRK